MLAIIMAPSKNSCACDGNYTDSRQPKMIIYIALIMPQSDESDPPIRIVMKKLPEVAELTTFLSEDVV